ncbi:MAG TPA: 3-hydroxyacyl-CoA dehydrogenase family protein [Chitinophagaceae bacterium]|nr:3-hydroxyacyl-CoA dehydrogenase family protein [Chitinophagaceae bacterium]
MQIVVHCNAALKEELSNNGVQHIAELVWVFEKVDLLKYTQADAVIDLHYEPDSVVLLRQCSGVKIINSVVDTLAETDASFVRINGWPTFLKAPIIEGSCLHGHLKKLAETVFSEFHKTIEWLPDAPGFVTPRVVSMIINEAYFALAEGVSTRAEMDVAMKLGTAYPFGPFEWSEKLGLKNIAALLSRLSQQQKRYEPAPLLLQEAQVI